MTEYDNTEAWFSIYSVDLTSGAYEAILKNPIYCSQVPDSGDWAQLCRQYADASVIPEDRERFLEETSLDTIRSRLTEADSVSSIEYRRQAPERPVTWCRAAAAAVQPDDQGRPTRFVLTMSDITAAKELARVRDMYEFSISGVDVFLWELDLVKDQITFAGNPFTIKRKKEIGYPDVVPNASKYILLNVMPESVETMKQIFADIHAGKEYAGGDIHFRAGGDAGYTICRIAYRVVKDENGTPVKAYGSEQNITDLVLSRNNYEKETARFAGSVENCVFKAQVNLTRNRVSAAEPDLFGLMEADSYDRVLEKPYFAQTRTDGGAVLSQILERGALIRDYTNGERQKLLHYQYPGNRWKWISVEIDLVQNPATSDVEMFMYCLDATRERIQEMTVGRLTDLVYDHIGIVRISDGSYMMQSAEGLTEYNAARSYSERVAELAEHVPADQKEATLAAFDFGLIAQEIEKNGICIINTEEIQEDGSTRYKMRQIAWLDDGKELLLVCVSDVTTEVTESLRRQEEVNGKLRDALMAAESANAAKSEFLSRMSHDIRTPMNAILGFSALLLRDPGDPARVADQARKILSSGNHLLGLINDVLDMSKIETGKFEIASHEFRMAEMLAMIDEIIRPQTEKRQQQFDLYVENLKHEDFVSDEQRLQQILFNILSNAVKYTQEGGKITLRVRGLPEASGRFETVAFEVSDNGRGMTEEYQKVIFEAFSREQLAGQEQAQGTGLGMAITSNLVHMMGGTIEVKSRLGEGSTFTVMLPMMVPDRDRDDAFWRDHDLTHMLVVDDEEEVCRNVMSAMAGTGVHMEHALDGATSVTMLTDAARQGDDFDIVLLDWKMPGMDGVETARAIRRSLPPEVLIIILTAYDYSAIEDEARAAGVDAFMPKPFFLQSLERAVLETGRCGDTGNGMDDDFAGEFDASAFGPGGAGYAGAAGAGAAGAGAAGAGARAGVRAGTRAGTRAGDGADREAGGELAGMHVLAAEDNALNAEVLTEILKLSGVTVVVKPNGREAAWEFLASPVGTYDMILMDVQMPVMNGYEATRLIRAAAKEDTAAAAAGASSDRAGAAAGTSSDRAGAQAGAAAGASSDQAGAQAGAGGSLSEAKRAEAASIPIIAMTANAFSDDVQRTLTAGMNAHVAKPVDVAVLKKTLAALRGRG